MSIVITGATGQLGRLVVKQLMAGGTPPDKIVATGREPLNSPLFRATV